MWGVSSSSSGVLATAAGSNPAISAYNSGTGNGINVTGSGSGSSGVNASGGYEGGSFYGQFGVVGSSSLEGVYGEAPASGGFPITAFDDSSNPVFYVDGVGDVYYHGTLNNFSKSPSGAPVRSFSAKMASPTVEDTGTAQLVGGAAAVRLDPTFAASIEPKSTYRVFLTPDGDTRGLFVATKTANGFIVRETQGGRSTLSFDYRIVATSLGEAGQRMAVMNPASMPPAIAHRAQNSKMVRPAATLQLP